MNFIISDSNVAPLHLDNFVRETLNGEIHGQHIFQAGEINKNFNILNQILTSMAKAGLDRQSTVYCLGGGVTGDMGGLAASLYMRGMEFVMIPTTLLSMVDSSIGGKLAIDLDGYKNLVGVFNNPSQVILDIKYLETLPERELNSGYGEMIKHALIWDMNHLEQILNEDKPSLESIQRSIAIKKIIVEQDPKEQGIRKILNFGHTLGHAFESISLLTNQPLLHGEAVALGLLYEARLNQTQEVVEVIKNALETKEIPTNLAEFDWAKETNFIDKVWNYCLKDKKNSDQKVKMSLLEYPGKCSWNIEVTKNQAAQVLTN